VANIIFKLGQLESKVDELTNRLTSALNTIARQEDDARNFKSQIASQVTALEQDVKRQRDEIAQLNVLLDATVESVVVKPMQPAPNPRPRLSSPRR
jgi:hypothetical protein